jgi:hypothetical protein
MPYKYDYYNDSVTQKIDITVTHTRTPGKARYRFYLLWIHRSISSQFASHRGQKKRTRNYYYNVKGPGGGGSKQATKGSTRGGGDEKFLKQTTPSVEYLMENLSLSPAPSSTG